MALIHCPNCGKEISDLASTCPGCGFTIQSVNEVDVKNYPKMFLRDKKKMGLFLIAVAFVFFVITIILLTNSKYKTAVEDIAYCKSRYDFCVSKSYGHLGANYSSLANDWKEMENSAKATTWIFRIISILCTSAAVPCTIIGIKFIRGQVDKQKNGEEET